MPGSERASPRTPPGHVAAATRGPRRSGPRASILISATTGRSGQARGARCPRSKECLSCVNSSEVNAPTESLASPPGGGDWNRWLEGPEKPEFRASACYARRVLTGRLLLAAVRAHSGRYYQISAVSTPRGADLAAAFLWGTPPRVAS